jgi:hypothetical protein
MKKSKVKPCSANLNAYFRMYFDCIHRMEGAAIRGKQPASSDLMQYAFLTVATTAIMAETNDSRSPEVWLAVYEDAILNLTVLTPRQFLNTFPPTKSYERTYQFGDYGSGCGYYPSIDVLQNLPQDEPIGEDIADVLWHYSNVDIEAFLMGYAQTLQACPGWESMWPDLLENMGLCYDEEEYDIPASY